MKDFIYNETMRRYRMIWDARILRALDPIARLACRVVSNYLKFALLIAERGIARRGPNKINWKSLYMLIVITLTNAHAIFIRAQTTANGSAR